MPEHRSGHWAEAPPPPSRPAITPPPTCTKAHDETAIRLLEEAFHLRMNGERAPGGNETWQDWDQRCEEFLRDVDTTSSPKRNREAQ